VSEIRKVIVDGEEFEVQMVKNGNSWIVSIKDREFDIKVEGMKNKISKNKKKRRNSSMNGVVSSNIPGKIITVNYEIGNLVNVGDVLLILEAMKMQNELTAPIKGIITEINCSPGDVIEASVPLIVIERKE